ncbi:hypothetical protein BDK51DRAFT_47518 [Blyttiomyces helicus]|uniref:Uncharacterized protein n=1 Tax=Blyttiomyces helicus TaxID=388810 RepID=A0A4P9W5M5_9FUNG|nr:hypothetical protein BDK51DRAFT_47518 [Blyttiomyces helicus]|eukprot:RKO86633.1 hypothetical protein BDK51DRAFT_47518 [Blyttiomyces helicus]
MTTKRTLGSEAESDGGFRSFGWLTMEQNVNGRRFMGLSDRMGGGAEAKGRRPISVVRPADHGEGVRAGFWGCGGAAAGERKSPRVAGLNETRFHLADRGRRSASPLAAASGRVNRADTAGQIGKAKPIPPRIDIPNGLSCMDRDLTLQAILEPGDGWPIPTRLLEYHAVDPKLADIHPEEDVELEGALRHSKVVKEGNGGCQTGRRDRRQCHDERKSFYLSII